MQSASGRRMNGDLETARTLALIALIFNVIGFLFALITIVLAIIPFLWMLLDYFLVYKPLTENSPESAETPALVLGILQILTLDFISGILLVVAWVKVRDGIGKLKRSEQERFQNL